MLNCKTVLFSANTNQISIEISCRRYKYDSLYRVSVDKTIYYQNCADAFTTVNYITNNSIELTVNLVCPRLKQLYVLYKQSLPPHVLPLLL